MKYKIQYFTIICLLIICFNNNKIIAQCVSAFPYTENFETTNGNWVSGGTGNTWAWGTPSKTNINTAGSGVKCWVTDGLTGTGYANCERSWVESPCFDFTLIANPAIAMKIYWECENTYDGATFQYSTNGGSTWTNVGAYNDPTNCMTANWFNSSNITHLGSSGSCGTSLASPKNGWCGNSGVTSGGCQGGNGSGGWVVAKHCLAGLGGLSSVKLRFAFGAGSSCNAYDGFAFDSVSVFDAPNNIANFSWACSAPKTVAFTNTSTTCANSFSWNFGDGTSASNTSTIANPTHTFSASGVYTVSFTASGPCNGSNTITQVINILSNTYTVANITCNGAANGSINTSTSTANGLINYTLMPNNITNATGNFTNLGQGVYSVNAIDSKGCSNIIPFIIIEPTIINASVLNTSTKNICNGLTNGIINCTANGGTGTINYTLLPNNITNTSGTFNNLGANTYSIVVKDANNCMVTLTQIINVSPTINLATTVISPTCNLKPDGITTISAIGGSGALNYTLQPSNIINNTGIFNSLGANNYTVIVKDANNCSNTISFAITNPASIIITKFSKTDINCSKDKNGSINIIAIGGTGNLNYSLVSITANQTNGIFNNLTPNNYQIQITDANNCIKDTFVTINLLSPEMQTSITSKNIGCTGSNNDGNATINITGGTSPITYLWNTNPVQTTATINNLFTGKYAVLITDANNCTAVDSVWIQPATCCSALFFPNVFTPNNDGINDVFFAKTFINLDLKTFEIYNRFGEKLWATNNINDAWDGSYKNGQCDFGIYYYFFKYKCLQDNKEYIIKGDILLSR